MTTQTYLGDSRHASPSPMSTPVASPLLLPMSEATFAARSPGSPYLTPNDSSWDQLQNQFNQQMSLQSPSGQASKSVSNNTFVHKLYNMVEDSQYQHLIAWTYAGASFVVCSITEFARDVLPKHFKHNNFSSFVRQLNMYGFHKVNKSPRGHRTLAENQIWEFSHVKFIKGRPDLLDEIKRKAIDNEVVRKENGDMNSSISVLQSTQGDMMQQLVVLRESFTQVMRMLEETRRCQNEQQEMIRSMSQVMTQHLGTAFAGQPSDVADGGAGSAKLGEQPPPIYITSPEAHGLQQQQQQQQHPQMNHSLGHVQSAGHSIAENTMSHMFMSAQGSPSCSPVLSPSPSHSPIIPRETAQPLNVDSHNFQSPRLTLSIPFSPMDAQQTSPSQPQPPLSPSSMIAYHSAVNTPLPPSPSLFSDDEAASLYSPHSPHAFAHDIHGHVGSNFSLQ